MPASLRPSWFVALLLLPTFAAAAPPTLSRVTPAALTPGKPVKIVIEGAELGADVSLLTSAKILAQKIVGQPAPNRVELEVTLDPLAPAGIFPLRAVTPRGISNSQAVAVDALPTTPFAPKIEALPAALYGNLAGPQVLSTSFQGKKDQAIVLEVEAQRLGSNLKPVVRLYDTRGAQLAWSPPRFQVGGDCRCAAVLPADGEYSIEVHDQLYRAADPALFRLKVGALQYAEATFPLAVRPGAAAPVKFLLSNLPGEASVQLDAATPPGFVTLPWPATTLASGGAPRAIVSDIPEFAGAIPANTAAPAGVTGILEVSGKEQTHTFNVTPGQKLRAKVVARSLGSPIDAVLTVRGPKGNQLAAADDVPGSSDPFVEFAAPGDASQVIVAVKDMQERGGPEFFYRVELRSADAPDFDASLATDRILIPAGGSLVLPLQLTRRNYDGPITLVPTGLPSEIKVDGLTIPAGATQALLSFSAPAGLQYAGVISLVGRIDGPTPVVRRVLFAETPGAKYQAWFRYEAGLAVAERSPIQLAWVTPADGKLIAGVKAPTTVQVSRAEGAGGKIRFRLVSTQPQPKKKIKENNQDKEVDDVDRTLRIEGAPLLAETQTALAEGLSVLVPGDLPLREWDLSLVAEMLSPDGKNVVASSSAPARRFTVSAPFSIELAGESAAQGRAGLGEAGVFRGKLNRAAGFNQAVSVTLAGLPKEISPPVATIAADKTDFELPLRFPFASKAGELKGLKLVAVLDRTAAVTAKSNEVDVAVNIVAGEKPPAEAPKAIFDEDAQFVAQLTEGSGQATLENSEKFSGKIAVKVTPDQRFNAKLPGLQLKIRENPGADEYRWLRFAWKKNGGKTIVLQLNHDGMWGPGGSGKPGAKFRYHAGPGGEQAGGSVGVDDKLPADFVVVTRDLFADFGEFTLDGIALTPTDGAYAVFDHIYLGKTVDDLNLAKTAKE